MKRTKPSTATLDLTNVSEAELLKNVADILIQPGPITEEQQVVLNAINAEFTRRDSLSLHGGMSHREIRVG